MITNKEKFLKVYANLPLGLRGDIVLVLDGRGSITWNAAYLEINNNTELSQTILKKLTDLKII